MSTRHTFIVTVMAALLGLSLAATGATATEAAPAAPVTLDTGSMVAPLVRMVLSLGAVLALVAALAWLARRLRGAAAQRGNLIEIVSALPLGTREKVLLLRVGEEQVLVGISPAGIRALHVIKAAAPATAFSSLLDGKP